MGLWRWLAASWPSDWTVWRNPANLRSNISPRLVPSVQTGCRVFYQFKVNGERCAESALSPFAFLGPSSQPPAACFCMSDQTLSRFDRSRRTIDDRSCRTPSAGTYSGHDRARAVVLEALAGHRAGQAINNRDLRISDGRPRAVRPCFDHGEHEVSTRLGGSRFDPVVSRPDLAGDDAEVAPASVAAFGGGSPVAGRAETNAGRVDSG